MQKLEQNSRDDTIENMAANVTALPRAHQPDLLSAMRRARLEDAERTLVSADLRAAEIGRLEHLRVKLAPLFDQAGRELVQFDHGLVASETPRLFIDMIAYVQMAQDRQTFTFVQDTRNGPVTLARSATADDIVGAITHYVAHRLVERERVLAGTAVLQEPASPQLSLKEPMGETAPVQFGEVIGLYLAGAISGAALIYAGIKVGWFG